MVIQLNIEDKILTEKISKYIDTKHKAVNELMIEALENFFSTTKSPLNYQVEDIEKNSTVIDFGLDETKEQILDNLKNSVEELQMIKDGKLQAREASKFLDEL